MVYVPQDQKDQKEDRQKYADEVSAAPHHGVGPRPSLPSHGIGSPQPPCPPPRHIASYAPRTPPPSLTEQCRRPSGPQARVVLGTMLDVQRQKEDRHDPHRARISHTTRLPSQRMMLYATKGARSQNHTSRRQLGTAARLADVVPKPSQVQKDALLCVQ